jgi:hypothetical protein
MEVRSAGAAGSGSSKNLEGLRIGMLRSGLGIVRGQDKTQHCWL